MTETSLRQPLTPRASQDLMYNFSAVAMLLFCIRDGFTGSLRYYLQFVNLGMVWFIPDLMAFVSFGIFVHLQFFKDKNASGIFIICAFLWSLLVSVIYMNDNMISFFSSIKMFLPIFVGFCFYGRSITEKRWTRTILIVIFIASTTGILLNPYVSYPWLGQTFTSFGMERQATKLWWAAHNVPRYGGFAGDSTMAAFMTLFTYVLISPYLSLLINILLWPVIFVALTYTNSKTAIGLSCIYVAFFIYIRFVSQSAFLKVLRQYARLSFACLLIPPFLMLTLTGVDLGSISPNLLSLADRINNTWQLPFIHIAKIFPVGLFIGCGIGCYSYPMDYTPLTIYQEPLDNFYLTTFLMMGYPFAFFVFLQYRGIKWIDSPQKLILILLWNIYTVTVQAYGPSYATLIYGYAFGEIFYQARKVREAKARAAYIRRLDGPVEVPQPGRIVAT